MIVLTDAEAETIRAALSSATADVDVIGFAAAVDAVTALNAATKRATPPEGRRLLLHLAPPVTVDLFVDLQRAVAKRYPEVGADPVGATIGSGDETTGLPIWVPDR